MDLDHRVSIRSQGRTGEVVVNLAGETATFWWEFGGGTCLAIVHVPSPEDWQQHHQLSRYPRRGFLQALAGEIQQRQCPDCRVELTGTAILFHQPGAPQDRAASQVRGAAPAT